MNTTRQEIETELEKAEEFFIWSDDKLALEDNVTDLLEFDDDLRFELYNMVIKSVGTKALTSNTVTALHNQVQKTLKKYVEYQVESR